MRLASTTLAVLLLTPGGVGAQERELVQVTDEIATMGVKLKTLVSEQTESDITSQTRKFSERLTDGEILFLLGDYSRASLVLYDLVMFQRVCGIATISTQSLYILFIIIIIYFSTRALLASTVTNHNKYLWLTRKNATIISTCKTMCFYHIRRRGQWVGF